MRVVKNKPGSRVHPQSSARLTRGPALGAGRRLLTSKPCFSDGTHTSLLAAQSAWLAAEKADLDVGDPGPASMDKKRATSLAPPPAGLDMVALVLGEEWRDKKKRERRVSERGGGRGRGGVGLLLRLPWSPSADGR